MGLFTNNKKLCPICSSPTPRIFPTSVEGMPICKECNRKVDLPDGMLNGMTLEEFRQYMDFYNQNQALRDIFTKNIQLGESYESNNLLIDTTHGLFRLKVEKTSLVFEASNLVSFQILEDNMPIFESAGDILKCHKSDIPERVRAMSDQVMQIAMQLQVYEEVERIEREKQRERERRGETETQPSYSSRPNIDLPIPLDFFYVELTLNHPYWGEYRGRMFGPRFTRANPSVGAYLDDYEKSLDKLHEMAVALMQMINPDAREVHDGADAQTAAADAVNEIKRYKELLDAGIITEAEFTAKKRQLLGI